MKSNPENKSDSLLQPSSSVKGMGEWMTTAAFKAGRTGQFWMAPIRSLDDGLQVASGLSKNSEAEALERAKHIVLCVNAHDALVEALTEAVASFEQLVKLGRIPENMKGLRVARAALAKAKAQPQ